MKCVAFQLFIFHYVLLVASRVIVLPSACGNHIYDINTSSIFPFHLAFFLQFEHKPLTLLREKRIFISNISYRVWSKKNISIPRHNSSEITNHFLLENIYQKEWFGDCSNSFLVIYSLCHETMRHNNK